MGEEFDIHRQELRRGTVVLACLELLRIPGYGYGLLEALDRRGFATDANTLYPLLRRLETQGLLASEWNTGHAPPRRYYRLSAEGKRAFTLLAEAWRDQVKVMGGFLVKETK